jgi:hypothetical protein
VRVEQAVFTSVRTRKSQGYHLIAASPGVNDQLARIITTWGPSHASLLSEDPDAQSYNFHPLSDELFAVSRTAYGGPEYSGRGGLQVFTHYLIVHTEHLQAYQEDPLALARTAQSLGLLRFQPIGREDLPVLELPDHSLVKPSRPATEVLAILPDLIRTLRLKHRVAIIGLDDPLPTLSKLLQDTPREERLAISFSTGLRLSVARSFRVHFARYADAAFYAQLSTQRIDYVTVA